MSRPVTFHVTIKLFLLLVSSVTLSNGKTGLSLNNCSCFMSGQYYNLKSLARLHGGPRFQSEKNNWNYAYNPCIPFSIEPPCEDVAICRWDAFDQSFTNLGLEKDMLCKSSKEGVKFTFKIPESQGWTTTIILKCNQTRKGVDDGNFSIIEDTSNPVLQLEHKCCCPDACSDDDPTATTAPVSHKKPYDIVGEVLGGFVGFVLIVVGIAFYCRRRNRRDEHNRPLIIDRPSYRAVENRDPGIEAPDPDDDASDNDDDASDNDVDASDNDVYVSDNDVDASDNEVEAPNADDEAPNLDDEAPDLDSEASDIGSEAPDLGGEAPDLGGEAPDIGGEAPVPDIGAPDPDDRTPDPEDEAREPGSVASDPDVGVPVPEVGAPDHDGEASVPEDHVSVSIHADSNMRGESPHIADVIPRISDEDLSYPIAVQSNPEDQCCEEEPSEPAVQSQRQPVEHSLESTL